MHLFRTLRTKIVDLLLGAAGRAAIIEPETPATIGTAAARADLRRRAAIPLTKSRDYPRYFITSYSGSLRLNGKAQG